MQKEFNRHIESLKKVFNFIKSFIREEKLDQNLESPLNLVIEELFTNMIKYSPDNPNKIKLEISAEHNQVILVLTDFDTDPFDIRQSKKYNTKRPLEKRPVGKIGLHLVKKYIDEINYEYQDRTSKITLIKYVGK